MKVGVLEFDSIGPGRNIGVFVDENYVNSARNMSKIAEGVGASEASTFVIRSLDDVLDFDFDLEESV